MSPASNLNSALPKPFSGGFSQVVQLVEVDPILIADLQAALDLQQVVDGLVGDRHALGLQRQRGADNLEVLVRHPVDAGREQIDAGGRDREAVGFAELELCAAELVGEEHGAAQIDLARIELHRGRAELEDAGERDVVRDRVAVEHDTCRRAGCERDVAAEQRLLERGASGRADDGEDRAVDDLDAVGVGADSAVLDPDQVGDAIRAADRERADELAVALALDRLELDADDERLGHLALRRDLDGAGVRLVVGVVLERIGERRRLEPGRRRRVADGAAGEHLYGALRRRIDDQYAAGVLFALRHGVVAEDVDRDGGQGRVAVVAEHVRIGDRRVVDDEFDLQRLGVIETEVVGRTHLNVERRRLVEQVERDRVADDELVADEQELAVRAVEQLVLERLVVNVGIGRRHRREHLQREIVDQRDAGEHECRLRQRDVRRRLIDVVDRDLERDLRDVAGAVGQDQHQLLELGLLVVERGARGQEQPPVGRQRELVGVGSGERQAGDIAGGMADELDLADQRAVGRVLAHARRGLQRGGDQVEHLQARRAVSVARDQPDVPVFQERRGCAEIFVHLRRNRPRGQRLCRHRHERVVEHGQPDFVEAGGILVDVLDPDQRGIVGTGRVERCTRISVAVAEHLDLRQRYRGADAAGAIK